MAKPTLLVAMFKSALKFGLIGALIVLIYTKTLSVTGLHYAGNLGVILGYLGIVIMPVCTYLAIREFKQRQESKLKLHHALIIGLIASIIAAAFHGFGNALLDFLFDTSYQETLIEKTRESMLNAGKSPEEIETHVKAMRDFYTSWAPHFNRFKWYVVLGFIYSLGSFVILRFIIKPK